MLDTLLAGLLVVAVVMGCMWLNSAAPFVFAVLIGVVIGAAGATLFWLWMFKRTEGPGEHGD